MMNFMNNIDWNQLSILWLMFEQVIAQSDAKENSSFQVLVSIVNMIIGLFTKKKNPVIPSA